MLTRKTQYAWMALGGLICLLGLVVACKLRDGNKASAQPELLPLPPLMKNNNPDKPPMDSTAPSTISFNRELTQAKSPPKPEKTGEQLEKRKPPTPKPTLEMLPLSSAPPPLPPPSSPKPQLPSANPAPVLRASFGGPSTPPPQTNNPPLTPPLALNESKSAPKVSGKDEPSKPSARLLTAPSPAQKPPTPSSPKPPAPDPMKQSATIPSWNVPNAVVPANAAPPLENDSARTQPGEPPLAPAPGPVQIYHVHGTETLQDIARRTLGSSERWIDLHKLNPAFRQDEPLSSGTTVRLPADACVQTDDAEPVKPLPALRPKPPTPKAKILPLTGTYQCSLDEKLQLTLPRAIRDQLNSSDTVLLSPGPDKCLWLTNQAHLERLGERLEQSHANEADVRVFKRLYYAQTEKLSVNGDGRVSIPERLGQFAGLHQEIVLVGIDDHFEVWDAGRWRSYTQQKSARQE